MTTCNLTLFYRRLPAVVGSRDTQNCYSGAANGDKSVSAHGKDLHGGTPWNAPLESNFAFAAESELCIEQ